MKPPTNLLPHAGSLIGREREITRVLKLLQSARLVTLTGPGGCGKTRLALEVADRLLEEHPDGVWVVELAAVSDPRLVTQTVAFTLGIREEPGYAITELLVSATRNSRLLLILDNCEHLVEPVSALAALLIEHSVRLMILATSREELGVAGEVTWAVPPLSVPAADDGLRPAELERFESVRLFLARGMAARPDFTLTHQNGPAVVQICRRLDGIPLAIELAAARLKVLTAQQIAGRLDEVFRLLRADNQGIPPRQRTLHATLAWSYDLLTEEEQRVLRRLAVFAGTFNIPAAEAVAGMADTPAGPDQTVDVLDILGRLVDRSLIQVEESRGEARYRLLEMLRQFAAQRLQACGDFPDALSKHCDWYLSLAEMAEPELWEGDTRTWINRLEMEHDNLRAALEACLMKDLHRGLVIAGNLWRFWEFRGYLSEGRRWLERLLTAAAEHRLGTTAAHARALFGAGFLARDEGDLARAREHFIACLPMYRELGDLRGVGSTLRGLGLLAQAEENYAEAGALMAEALQLFREIDHQLGVGWTLRNLGIIAQLEQDYATAEDVFTQSLPILRAVGDRSGIGRVLGSLGILARITGRLTEARPLLEDSLRLMIELNDQRGVSMALVAMAVLASREGNEVEAKGLLSRCLQLSISIGDRESMARAIATAGLLLGRQTSQEQGVQLISVATSAYPRLRSVIAADERDELDGALVQARRTLGEDLFATASTRGRIMGLEEAARDAQAYLKARQGGENAAPASGTASTPTSATTSTPMNPTASSTGHADESASAQAAGWAKLPAGLTRREAEVLRLVADGRTNREIADALTISQYTVMRHMSNIFTKLGTSSRAAAAAFATREGLA